MTVGLILVAAGEGKRIGGKTSKQFVKIHGKPLLAYTLEKFAKVKKIYEVVIAVPPGKEKQAAKPLGSALKKFRRVAFVSGGKTRQESVFNALQCLSDSITHVLVHDGVRPFVNSKKVAELIGMLATEEAVILASPATDTVKRAASNAVAETLDRRQIFLAETPQGFKKELLLSAHLEAQKKRFTFSDDSALVEALGRRVAICPSDGKNLKITSPADLALARLLLPKR
ncbi:MAG: 2-C-methyl-D-erythritol 4-phosphate cytidylyltransferase [candidate division Zixibacteria bacterium]|nr:2-C-methyl-D-erythritol 4-phosphate cytidylyltransferase [candidate division Zixibacteria bacterium]MCI0594999.1 2-C-methyl-D-erythritol 4-phosphate cytidylyltransferase [candidate division Zixibacteria bacterium]